jgi:hypothetical protein
VRTGFLALLAVHQKDIVHKTLHPENAGGRIAHGQKLERSDLNRPIGLYLNGVKAALTELGRDSNDCLALDNYEFAILQNPK